MMRNQELFRDEFFGKDNLALLDTVALEQIAGGDSYNLGTLNWVNEMGSDSPYQSELRTSLDDKFAQCLNGS